MRHIYKMTKTVIIWLDSESEDSHLAFDLLIKLFNIRKQRYSICRYGVILREHLGALNLPNWKMPDWSALNSLFSRP